MSKILEQLQGSDKLDTTVTVKINSADKQKLIKFCEKQKISLGKLIRYGADMAVEAVEAELKK